MERVSGIPAEPGIWNFSEPETVRSRLAGAGFADIQVELQGDDILLRDRRLLERFLTSVILGSHLEGMPEGERRSFVERVADHLPKDEIDYVRLTISAVRAG